MEHSEKKDLTRRNFLEAGILGGLGISVGLAAGELLAESGRETVRLLTPSGEIVEVEKRFLPKSNGRPVSNQQLKAWMEAEK